MEGIPLPLCLLWKETSRQTKVAGLRLCDALARHFFETPSWVSKIIHLKRELKLCLSDQEISHDP
jgi:hypothetical protein